MRSKKSGLLLAFLVLGAVLIGESSAFSEDHPPPDGTRADASRDGTFETEPSKLDYLVMASLADSHSLLLSSAYRAPLPEAVADMKKATAASDCPDGE